MAYKKYVTGLTGNVYIRSNNLRRLLEGYGNLKCIPVPDTRDDKDTGVKVTRGERHNRVSLVSS